MFYNPVSIVSVEPNKARFGGTPVSITGSGFTNETKVLFGLAAAISVEVIDDGTLLAVTPVGVTGATDVHVSNSDGVGSKEKGFFYQGAGNRPGFSPNSLISGGNTVTIRSRPAPGGPGSHRGRARNG